MPSIVFDGSVNDPRFTAAIDLIARTGSDPVFPAGVDNFQIRYSDDEEPTVWMAVVSYRDGKWEVDADANPVAATLRLANRLIGGAQCTHCDRNTAITEQWDKPVPKDGRCWYVFDPETGKFRRSCESD